MTKEQEVAIKYLEDMKNNLKDLNKSGYVYAKENIETVLNMLKEKEKQNKELMDEYHKRVQEKIDLEQDIKVLKDDLEDKRLVYIDTPEFQDSYIPKQKLKDKIEEFKNENYQIALDSEVAFDTGIMKNNLKIQVLEELLQESEDK